VPDIPVPDVGTKLAVQLVVVPLDPVQFHTHGDPLPPVTAPGVPFVHRPAVGAVVKDPPFDAPQERSWAEQEAVVPPFAPAQLHVHGPAPDTADAVPALHSPLVGFVGSISPFDAPQVPFTVVVKLAVTISSWVTVSLQVVPRPEHAPPHPEKVDPEFGLSVKVTLVPLAMGCEQLAPEQDTVPLPVPAIVIEIV